MKTTPTTCTGKPTPDLIRSIPEVYRDATHRADQHFAALVCCIEESLPMALRDNFKPIRPKGFTGSKEHVAYGIHSSNHMPMKAIFEFEDGAWKLTGFTILLGPGFILPEEAELPPILGDALLFAREAYDEHVKRSGKAQEDLAKMPTEGIAVM